MKRAFTLIELLIVVAIIAILAAIAVPNFLEAQMRSKVSRARSDMRTLATAIESYMIDNNNVIGSNDANIPDPYGFEAAFARLTTPVAYMTSILKDPFVRDTDKPLTGGRRHATYSMRSFNKFSTGKYLSCFKIDYRWGINSVGPNCIDANLDMPGYLLGTVASQALYDPTNGTTSRGYILRTNKGDSH